ncbi:MAG: hypothetical protein ACJAYG_000421 [Oceanicoccus sp.]|jgi:hypothetical protein
MRIYGGKHYSYEYWTASNNHRYRELALNSTNTS